MKKEKIMLSAIALFAIVGGALAFKAHSKNLTVTYTICNSSQTCVQVTTVGKDVSASQGTRDVTIANATLDVEATGACNDQIHPCTGNIFYSSTTNI